MGYCAFQYETWICVALAYVRSCMLSPPQLSGRHPLFQSLHNDPRKSPTIIRRIARTDARAIENSCSFMRGVGGNRLLPIDRACAIADDDSVD